jgi:hypothetical protein
MARGWESKAVEGQIEARRAGKPFRRPRPVSPAQVDLLRKREDLLLSRTRVLRDLESALNPRYKLLLNAALTHLDQELARLPEQVTA